MITMSLHNITHVAARYRGLGPDNNLVDLTFPGSDAKTIELNLFFGPNQDAALALVAAITTATRHTQKPIDEQE